MSAGAMPRADFKDRLNLRFFPLRFPLVILLIITFLSAVCGTLPAQTTNYTVVGWNNLGMHCMDADYSVFSILPPYNTILAQVIDSQGLLVTNPSGLTVTYEAVADPSGSINTTSVGKTTFWQFVHALFGLSLPADVGLPVPGPNSYAMPGSNNVAQTMDYDTNANWFAAYGIPLTPRDDAMQTNSYPMMRLVARHSGAVVATADIVLPVSDEMDCRACHASGSGPAAQPAAGWVNDPNAQRDYRLNILRLHDDRQLTDSVFQAALTTLGSNGYSTNGLTFTVLTNGVSILCAACHLSEALPGSGINGVKPLTEAVHAHHATVLDPTNGMTLDSVNNRSACYRCHPGSTTRCLRGAMGKAVASDGSMLLQCQSCHGSMSTVGATNRVGWLMEPNCQACHSGDALSNSGQIRFTSAFSSSNVTRVAVNQLFATNPNTPGAGLSLFRFSRGHGGLYCEACHGSTHAEFPSSHQNDNVTSIQHQGHLGVLVECEKCHRSQSATVNGGPHGMHPLGKSWVGEGGHARAVEAGGTAQCRACHGLDYTGTVLSLVHGDRTISTELGTKVFWSGYRIGCYTCHNGPGSESRNTNKPPVAKNSSASTATNTAVAIPLSASSPAGKALTLRIISQSSHGTVGLSGTVATYFPDAGYSGGDTFTFAAWDGQLDSNLGTVFVTIGGSSGGGCAYTITPTAKSVNAFLNKATVTVTAGRGCGWTAASNASWLTITAGTNRTGKGTVKYTVAPNANVSARMGTLTIAGHTFTVTQAGSTADLTGIWSNQAQVVTAQHLFKGALIVENVGQTNVPRSRVAIYLSGDNSLDGSDLLLRRYNVPKLAPRQTSKTSVSVKTPVGVSAAGKYVIALVDAEGIVPDINASNNVVVTGPLQ